MDLNTIIGFIALARSLIPVGTSIYSTIKNTNESLAQKVEDVAGTAWPAIKPLVQQFFPQVQPALQPAAAALLADHDRVKLIQQALKDRGYAITNVDGWYGNETKAAVTAYQQATPGFVVDSWAGVNTQKSLGVPL